MAHQGDYDPTKNPPSSSSGWVDHGSVSYTRLDPTTILDEAKTIVYGDREQTYGHPNINFERIAALWSVILEKPITLEQVGWCMIATKMARDMQVKKRDNLVDTAGYAAAIERIGGYE